jgi:hypothetical protein
MAPKRKPTLEAQNSLTIIQKRSLVVIPQDKAALEERKLVATIVASTPKRRASSVTYL